MATSAPSEDVSLPRRGSKRTRQFGCGQKGDSEKEYDEKRDAVSAATTTEHEEHSPRHSVITRQIPSRGDRTDVDPESVRLWDALARARATDDPGALAAAEDGVFRFYLPLAHAIAQEWASGTEVAIDVVRGAELGLAEAVLARRQPGSRGFEAFARVVITAELRRGDSTRRRHRPGS